MFSKKLFVNLPFVLLALGQTPSAQARNCPDDVLPEPNCASDCTAITNGKNITIAPGSTYCVKSGVNAKIQNLEMQGGTLLVCGTLTVTDITVANGKNLARFNIGSTAHMHIKGSGQFDLNGSTYLSNRGQFSSDKSITMNNLDNAVANTGNFAMAAGTQFGINGNNCRFSNMGDADLADLRLINQNNSGGSRICLDDGSTMATRNFSMISNNEIGAGGKGRACFSFSGQGDLQAVQSFANTDLIDVCQKVGATTLPAAPTSRWGNAKVSMNCINCSSGAPLPVELTKFEATERSKRIVLNWTTATEKNNESFAVERSSDGKNFQEIHKVAGAGTSNVAKNYSHEDSSPLKGVSYYRLRQKDADGKISLSSVVVVKRSSAAGTDFGVMSSNDPNSVRIFIDDAELYKNAKISITSMSGAQVFRKEGVSPSAQGYDIALPTALKNGVYVISITLADGSTVSRKLIR